MSVEENKRLILGFFENLSAGKGEAVMGALADNATWWVQGNFALSGTKTTPLAFTGFNPFPLVIAGVALILFGCLGRRQTLRRRERSAT